MNSDINNISNRTIFRVLLIILLFVVGMFLVISVSKQLVWLGISFFLALALEPPVNWLSGKLPKRSRGLAVLLVVTATLSVIAYVIAIFGPPLVKQFSELINNLPSYYKDFLSSSNPFSDYLNSADIPKSLSLNGQKITTFFTSTGGGVINTFSNIFSSVLAFFTILVLTFFMVLEWPKWHRLFWKYQDPSKLAHRKSLYGKMQKTVSGYISGNLLTSLIAGSAAVIFLLILKNPFAVALGFTVAVLDLIPMFGALLASVIAIAIVMVYNGITPAIATAIFFFVYQQLENNILQPIVFSKTVNISPLVAGIAAVLGASLGGLVGALVAIPIAASLQILAKDYLDRKYSKK